jgi:DNA-nicking Smr family endonuclease
MKILDAQDKALWKFVKKTIRPLKPLAAQDDEETLTLFLPPSFTPRLKTPPLTPTAQLKPLAPLEKNIQRGLKRKQVDVQAKLDLHGLFQDAAHTRLKRFLHEAQKNGFRLVIVVTGKGANGTSVLRQNVPLWLAMPDLRGIVMGFQQAEAHHGGEGALYVRLRQNS